jgi:hypothetical protein
VWLNQGLFHLVVLIFRCRWCATADRRAILCRFLTAGLVGLLEINKNLQVNREEDKPWV